MDLLGKSLCVTQSDLGWWGGGYPRITPGTDPMVKYARKSKNGEIRPFSRQNDEYLQPKGCQIFIVSHRQTRGELCSIVLPCKAKMQYLLTLQVSRYCLLTLQSRVGNLVTSKTWPCTVTKYRSCIAWHSMKYCGLLKTMKYPDP